MAIVFMDLDNTLIYSHRHTVDEPIVWVEELNGRKQSFITEKAFSYFKSQNRYEVIPITTRTKEQYERLSKLSETLNFEYALICNGAVLLVDGKEDKSWKNQSMEICREDAAFFYDVLEKVRTKVETESIISVDPFMFYVKTKETETMYNYMMKIADKSHLLIYRDSRKVYCIPSSLSKGKALERFKILEYEDFCLAAGDSDFDVSMLNLADVSFCPEELFDSIASDGIVIKCSGFFLNDICYGLERIENEVDNRWKI